METGRDQDAEERAAPFGPGESDANDEPATANLGVSLVGRTGTLVPARIGDHFGRYTLLEELGRGGMGIVYRAYDPELHRAVALKILRIVRSSEDSSPERREAVHLGERLVREAQALARLSHPHVVAVHDMGSVEGSVYVAMELVEGLTVRRWLRTRARPWREIVRIFAEAGAGLGAAHAAGVIHRDFKPDNVVVGTDGRVRVLDFGLARIFGPNTSDTTTSRKSMRPPAPSSPNEGEVSGVGPSLTNHGVIMGTQAYMAPEQLGGASADARSDQYAYAISLYEALAGRRPFSAPRERHEPDKSFYRDLPRGHTVPRHLRRVLARALALDPEDRYPDMSALVADLERDPVRRLRHWVPLALSGVAIAVAVVVGRRAIDQKLALCRGGEQRLGAVWDDGRKRAVEAAFLSTGLSSARASAERVVADLDTYGQRWVDTRREACEATRVRGEQSEAALDARMACLDLRLLAAKSQIDVFAAADATVVSRGILAVAELPSLESCSDVDALRRAVPLPRAPGSREVADAITLTLSQARALVQSGKYERATILAGDALQRARKLPFRPLEAEALFLLGRAEDLVARYPEAERHLVEGARAAVAGRRDDTLAEAWTSLVRVQGLGLRHFEDAHESALSARAAVERLSDDVALRSNLLRQESDLAYREGKYDVAEQKSREAVTLAERTYPPTDLRLGGVLLQLGMAQSMLNRMDEAERTFQRSIAIAHASGLHEHTNIAAAINNIGYIESQRGHDTIALEHFTRARDMWVHTLGPNHPQVADVRLNVGSMLVGFNRLDEGLEELEKARAVYVALRGPGSVDEATILGEIAGVHAKRKEHAAALALYDEAISTYEKKGNEPDEIYAYAGRGEELLALGRFEDARRDFDKALAVTLASQGVEHPRALELRLSLARISFREGHAAEGLATAKVVSATANRTNAPPLLRFHAMLVVARIASNVPAEKALAGRNALALFELAPQLPSGGDAWQKRMQEWIAQGTPPAPLDEDVVDRSKF